MHAHLLAQLVEVPPEYLLGAAAVFGAFVLLLLILRLRRRWRVPVAPPVDLSIDLDELGDDGPPPAGVSLELYNLPVRLAAVVVAPAGRGSQLPGGVDVAALVDFIVPGLAEIMLVHKPLVRRWPAQLSTQGFSHLLFANVPLPGDRGKGTPWSVVAGRFETGQQNVLAGLVVRAAGANTLGQLVVERPGQWLDLFRVRRQ